MTQPKERKIINLDAMIPDSQIVILDAQEHVVNPPTTEMYLTVMQAHRRIKDSSNEVEQTRQSIQLITLACPTIPESRLLKLPLKALMALADAITEMMEDVEEATVDGAEVSETGE